MHNIGEFEFVFNFLTLEGQIRKNKIGNWLQLTKKKVTRVDPLLNYKIGPRLYHVAKEFNEKC